MASNIDNKVWLAIIVALTLVLGAAAFMFVSPMFPHEGHGEEGQHGKINSLLNALQSFKGDANYTLVKTESVNGKNKTITVVKNGSVLFVKAFDPTYFLTSMYYADGNTTKGCIEFAGSTACTDPNKHFFLATLKGEDDAYFVKGYIPVIKVLAEKGALHLEKEYVTDGEKCFVFNYSFGDLPVKEVMALGYPTNPAQLAIVYKSILCLNDELIFFFEKNYTYAGENYNEWVKLKEIKDEPESIHSLPPNDELSFKGVYNAWNTFTKDMDKGQESNNTDGSLTGLASRYDIPELCFRTSNPDNCLGVYVSFSDTHKDKAICDMMVNETLKNQCYSYVEGTATENNETTSNELNTPSNETFGNESVAMNESS